MCMHVCMCVYVHVYICVYVCVCARVCMCVTKYSYIFLCFYSVSEKGVDDSPVLTPDPISIQFSNFVASVEECLKKCTNKLEACKSICSNLTIHGSDELLFNNQQLAEINDCTSFRQLFTLLRQHWNWKEYSILRMIIEMSESVEAKAHLEKYEKVI